MNRLKQAFKWLLHEEVIDALLLSIAWACFSAFFVIQVIDAVVRFDGVRLSSLMSFFAVFVFLYRFFSSFR